MAGRTYVVLGGGGAFGVTTTRYLLDHTKPAKVVGIGRAPLRPEPFSLGIEKRERYEYQVFHVGSETDMLLEYLDRLRPDVVVSFCAQGEGAASWKHSWRFFATNGTELVRLYEEISKRDYVQRFVQIGSSEIYGSVARPAKETDPIVPSSPYSASKASFDLYLLAMAQQGKGVPMNILRPSNCYCPGQLLHRIIPRAIVAGLLGRKVPLHGGGAAKKSYLHAQDLARAIYLVSEKAPAGTVYNVGPLNPTSIREVAEQCAATVGKALSDVFDVAPERVGQDGQYWLDSSAIARDVGWSQEIHWAEGLDGMRDWAEKYLDQLRDWPTDYQLRA